MIGGFGVVGEDTATYGASYGTTTYGINTYGTRTYGINLGLSSHDWTLRIYDLLFSICYSLRLKTAGLRYSLFTIANLVRYVLYIVRGLVSSEILDHRFHWLSHEYPLWRAQVNTNWHEEELDADWHCFFGTRIHTGLHCFEIVTKMHKMHKETEWLSES